MGKREEWPETDQKTGGEEEVQFLRGSRAGWTVRLLFIPSLFTAERELICFCFIREEETHPDLPTRHRLRPNFRREKCAEAQQQHLRGRRDQENSK